MIKNLKNKKKGFTLIELIIVIAIIAILAAVALPKFGDVRKKANISADIANAKTIQGAVTTLIADDKVATTANFTLDSTAETGEANITAETETKSFLQGALPTAKLKEAKGNPFIVDITDGVVTISVMVDKTKTEVYPNGKDDYIN